MQEKRIGLALIDVMFFRCRLDVRLAPLKDPLWWHIDVEGRCRTTLLGLYYSNADGKREPLLGMVLGPLLIRFGWLRA